MPGDGVNVIDSTVDKGVTKKVVQAGIVKKISGPETLTDSIYAKYKVKEYKKQNVTQKQKDSLLWIVEVDKKKYKVKKRLNFYGIIECSDYKTLPEYKGESLVLEITEKMKSKKIKVFAYVGNPEEDIYAQTQVTWSQVGIFMSLVRKAEVLHQDWTSEDMVSCLRRIGGYDTLNFRVMLSGDGNNPLPAGPRLSDSSLSSQLQRYLMHRGNTPQNETGKASGIPVEKREIAMGHVITGIAGGFRRHRSLNIGREVAVATGSGAGEFGSERLGVGENIDNLYALTISGDLGQSATIMNEYNSPQSSYIGWRTDATYAELVGDIDGFNIGNNMNLFSGKSDITSSDAMLSEILQRFYSSNLSVNINRTNRFATFRRQGMTNLEQETINFAVNFSYAHRGRLGGLFSSVGGEAKESYAEFKKWIDNQ